MITRPLATTTSRIQTPHKLPFFPTYKLKVEVILAQNDPIFSLYYLIKSKMYKILLAAQNTTIKSHKHGMNGAVHIDTAFYRIWVKFKISP